MKTLVLTGLVMLGLALCWSGGKAAPEKAKSSGAAARPVWKFTSVPQMKALITKCLNNPRATYYIIVRARRLGMEKEAALFYRSFLKEETKNGVSEPKHSANHGYVMAAYAFSHYVAVGPSSREYFIQNPPSLVQQLRDYGLEADGYRTWALQEEPNSPEVLLETSLAVLDGSSATETRQQRILRAIGYTRKAVRLAPEWADARYWLANHLHRTATLFQGQTDSWYREALVHYDKAEKLEPQLRPECLRERASIWSTIGQNQKAFQCLEAYIKLRPESLKQPYIVKWRARLTKELKAKGITPKVQ